MRIPQKRVLACAFALTALCATARADDPSGSKTKHIERGRASVVKYLTMPREDLVIRVKSGFKLCADAGLFSCGDPVFALGMREDVTADDKALVLSAQLKDACESPPETNAFPGREKDLTAYKNALVEGLFLAGPGVASHLRKELAATGKSGVCRPWLVMALAYQNDPAVIAELLKQSVESEDFSIRAGSVRAFHRGGAIESISVEDIKPFLKKWLNDPNHTDGEGSDIKFPTQHADWNITYPVRAEALSVLLKKKIRYQVQKHEYSLIE